MNAIEQIDHGEIRELRLCRPPVNALDPNLVEQLHAALRDAMGEGAGALVLSGQPGMFSAGLDVPALMRLPRPKLGRFWGAFLEMTKTMAGSPIPIVSAITGHSPAGGCVMALMTDHRVMARGEFRIGLNEVQVGIPVPEPLHEMLAYSVGPRWAERLLVPGLLVPAEQALQIGLVDELVAPDAVVPRAIEHAQMLLARPRQAMLATRKVVRAPLVAAARRLDDQIVAGLTEAWFSDETQTVLGALVAKLAESSSSR